MLVFANAKINIGLHITGRLADGYHTLETLFYPVPWCDILEVLEQKKYLSGAPMFLLHSSGLSIEGPMEKNLCYKAYALLNENFKLPPVEVYLHKQIPMGAGLGGGSSNAAAMLKVLNTVFDLKLTKAALLKYAIQLGADCSFFMENKPCYATGKGEQLKVMDISLAENYIVIVKPEVHISTAYAYSKVVPHKPDVGLEQLLMRPKEEWCRNIKNDFEEFIFPENPQIERIKSKLYEHGAWYASMSGSGSAVYGLFKESPPQITFDNYLTWTGLIS